MMIYEKKFSQRFQNKSTIDFPSVAWRKIIFEKTELGTVNAEAPRFQNETKRIIMQFSFYKVVTTRSIDDGTAVLFAVTT